MEVSRRPEGADGPDGVDPGLVGFPEGDGAEISAILLAAARGDESAWRVLIARYSRRVFALAKSRVRSAELAEEVTQSVFVTVASKLGSGGYTEQGRFEPWLFRVVMNRVRDEVRRGSRQAAPTDPASMPVVAVDGRGAGVDPAVLESLRGALGRLSEQDREVIELRHHGQMSFKAMADLLGEPLGTLLARHHRALKKLHGLIAGPDGADEGSGERSDGASGSGTGAVSVRGSMKGGRRHGA